MPGRAPPAHRSQLARSLGLRTLLTGHTALFHALSPHSGSLTRHCPTSPQNPLAENLKINHGYFTTALFLSSQLRINEPGNRRLKFRPRQATSSAELIPKSSMLSHKKIRGAGHLPAKWPKPVLALNSELRLLRSVIPCSTNPFVLPYWRRGLLFKNSTVH